MKILGKSFGLIERADYLLVALAILYDSNPLPIFLRMILVYYFFSQRSDVFMSVHHGDQRNIDGYKLQDLFQKC